MPASLTSDSVTVACQVWWVLVGDGLSPIGLGSASAGGDWFALVYDVRTYEPRQRSKVSIGDILKRAEIQFEQAALFFYEKALFGHLPKLL
jgi:hypothetical protein